MAEELEDCPNAELLPFLEKATLLLQRAPDEMLIFKMAADTARDQIQRLSKAVSERSKQNKKQESEAVSASGGRKAKAAKAPVKAVASSVLREESLVAKARTANLDKILKFIGASDVKWFGNISLMTDFRPVLHLMSLPYVVNVCQIKDEALEPDKTGSASKALRTLVDSLEPHLLSTVQTLHNDLASSDPDMAGHLSYPVCSRLPEARRDVLREGKWCQELLIDPCLKAEHLGGCCIPWILGIRSNTVVAGFAFMPVCGMPGFLLCLECPCNVILVHEDLLKGEWSSTEAFIHNLDWRLLRNHIGAGLFYVLKLMPNVAMWIPPRFSPTFAPDSADAFIIWQPWANRRLLQTFAQNPANPFDHTEAEKIVEQAKKITESQRSLGVYLWPVALEFLHF